MWVGIAEMRSHLAETLDKVPSEMTPMDRILAAVEAHLRHELELSDCTTASIRNSGQAPAQIRTRQAAEESKYGEIWQKLIKDAIAEGQIRGELDSYSAQMLVLGALNWAAEWWNPRRGSLETVVRNAQFFVRNEIGVSPSA